MDKNDWAKYEELYEAYEDARTEYEKAQARLRGTFSELARFYEPGTLNDGRFVTEEKAHERFLKAREKLHRFMHEKLKIS